MWPFNRTRRPRIDPVDAGFATGPQIRPEDVAWLAEQGFAAILCARPDAEEPGQTPYAQIAAEARMLGLAVTHIPVSGAPDPAQIGAFEDFMAEARGPVFGYCRSGARARALRG